MVLPDKFKAICKQHAYVKSIVATKLSNSEYSVTWNYDLNHEDIPETFTESTTTSHITRDCIENWLKTGGWELVASEADDLEATETVSEAFEVFIEYRGSHYKAKNESEAFLIVKNLREIGKNRAELDKYEI